MTRGPKKQPDRVQAVHFHLTYAALYPGELTHASIQAASRGWAADRDDTLLEWQTGREDHDQPADAERSEHFHVYVHFGKRYSIRNRRTTKVFDLRGRDDRELHPEVQAVGAKPLDRERVLRYGQKDGDFENDLREELPEEEEDGEEEESWAEQLNKVDTVRTGMMLLMEEHPNIYYTMGARIEPMLHARLGDTSSRDYKLSDFNRAPLELDGTPIVLHGLSGAGKTEFAVAHFEHPYIVRRRDDLKRLSFISDGIIFDDMDFRDWPAEEVIALLNWTKNRTVAARYSDAQLPARVPLVFTTNLGMTGPYDNIFPPGRNTEQAAAIARRHQCIAVEAPLFG